MDADLIDSGAAVYAPLTQFGILAVSGEDARAFLHAQLSNDIQRMPPDAVRRAGYCSAKGRLLASFLVVPAEDGFLLQLSADLTATVAKRLAMFVLRSKVKIVDASTELAQFGAWGAGAAASLEDAGFTVPAEPMRAIASNGCKLVALDAGRYLLFGPADTAAAALTERFAKVAQAGWTLADVRAGLPVISQVTQDLFVPQMANFELIGGIDFKKGCYPGQEIVARSQYLGKLKRRMYRGTLEANVPAAPLPAAGADIFGAEPQAVGTVVSAAPRPQGGYELLAVLQSAEVERGGPLRLGSPEGPPILVASLPYAV